MALKWNQFAGSDYYRKLPEAEQGAARRRFFDDQVAPRYSAEQREGAWADFDRRATMMPATVATPAQAPASIQRPQANVAARAAIATAAPEQAAMPQRPVRPGQVQPAASAPAIAAPAGGAGFVEGMKDFGRTAVKSVVQGIPEAAANLADYIDTPEFDASGRQISDDGALSKWARATRAAAEKRGEPWQESTFGQEARAKDDMSWRGGAGAAGESMGLSWGPGLAGAAAGAAIGSMAGGVGAIPGAAAGYAIGSLATLPLFFGAQAKDTYDRVFKQAKIDNPELDDESAHDKAVVAGGFTGLIEAAGERVSDIVGGKLFRLMPPGVKNGMVRAATKSFQGVRQMIADMLKIVGTEVGTELAQGASQSAVEASYGVGEGPTWQNQKGVIVPTIIMSLVGGGAAQGVSAAARYRTAKLLQDPARDPEQRLIAARNVAGAIHQQDPELAKLFLGEAQNLIAARKPVIAEGDQFYRDLKPLAQREEDQRMAAGKDMPSEEARTAAFGEAPADVPRGTEIPPEAFAQPEGAEATDTLATDENGDILIEDGGEPTPLPDIQLGRTDAPIAGELYNEGDTTDPVTGARVPGVAPPTEQPITDAAAVAPPQEPQAVEPAPLAAPAENGSTLQGEMVEPLNPEARKQHMNAIGANLKVLRAEREAAKKAGDEALMAEVDDEIQATAVNFKRLANNQAPLPTPREQAAGSTQNLGQDPAQNLGQVPAMPEAPALEPAAARPKNDGIDLADEQPVKALDDERMQDPDFRNWMESAVGGLVSVKDGNLGLAVDPNFIKGESDRGDEVRMVRSSSVNPPWFQEIAAAENVSVDGLRGIVKKAMTGAKLGVRQDRAVRKLMDAITDERIGELQDWGRGLGMSAEEVAGLHNDNPVAHMRALEAEVSARQKKAADAEVEQQWAEQDAVVAGKKPFTPDVVLGEDAVDLEGVDFSEAGQIASQVYATAAGWGVPIAQLDELHAQAPDAESFLSSVRTAIQEIRANEKARSERDKAGSLADIGGQGAPESGESAAAEAERLAAIEQARAEAIPALEEYLGTDWRKDNERRARLAAASPEELVEEVYRDKMTGLLNKRAWNEDVVKAGFEKGGRRSKPNTIAYIDLDGLKFLNDEMGHAAGDELLANFGKAMKAAGIDGYHISGDEFGAIFENEADASEAMDRLQREVESSVVRGKAKDGRGITNTGIAFSYGLGGSANSADMAMQENKKAREAQGLRGGARGGMPSTAAYDEESVLQPYDQAAIDAKAAEDKARAKKDADAAAKQKADDERGEFVLAGSARPADQAAARGAQDMFSGGGEAPAAPKAKPSANTIFTEDAAEKARAVLRAKLGQVNTGIDPEIVQAGITLAGYHIEKGARSFAAYAKAMLDDLGDSIRPYLKSWYVAVKLDPRAAGLEGMDSLAAVESVDVGSLAVMSEDSNPAKVGGDRRMGDPNLLGDAAKAVSSPEQKDGVVYVPVGAPVSGGENTSGTEGGVDGALARADKRRNPGDNESLIREGYGSLDVPRQAAVLKTVLSLIHDDKIFRSVVPSIPVDVMNDLVAPKFSAKQALSDKAVLIYSLATNNDLPVRSAAIDAIISAPAFPVAEVTRVDSTGASEDVSIASKALNGDGHDAATSSNNGRPLPTQAQIEAGNYKKAHINWNGLDVTIENPVGSIRFGLGGNGKPWATKLQSMYGYLKRTEAADGEQVDVFINPDEARADKVVVIDQYKGGKKSGGYDEAKVMVGYPDKMAAINAYKGNYPDGWQVGPATEMSVDEFKAWLKDGDAAKPAVNTRPARTDQIGSSTPKESTETSAPLDMDGFLDGETPIVRSRAAVTLSKNVQNNGRVISRLALIREKVTAGSTVVVAKDGRRLQSADGAFLDEAAITKTGMDYAEHLIAARNLKAADPAQDAPTKTIKKGDRFTDAQGNTWEVWNARTSLIEAFPVVDGKIRVNSQDGQRWATDDRARFANPEARTDFTLIKKEKQVATPQLLSNAQFNSLIQLAADSIDKLRASDVDRVITETPAPLKVDMASRIKAARPDLSGAVDEAMEAAAPAAKPKPADLLGGEQKPKTRIADFGERIEGAAKYRDRYSDQMTEAMEADIAAVPLSESWPEPDYEKMLEEGADPGIVAFVHAARDEIPVKPKKRWKVAGWTEAVRLLRDVSNGLINGSIPADKFRETLAKPEFMRVARDVGGRADLYQAVGHGVSLKGVTLRARSFSRLQPDNSWKEIRDWGVEREAKASAFGNWPQELGVGNTREEAIAAFKAKHAEMAGAEKPDAQTSFEIYRYRANPGVVVIGKKIGKDRVDLAQFPTIAEARSYLKDNHDALVAKLEAYKKIPRERRLTNEPRVGVNHRNGGNVTEEQFKETFGFRGGQFGSSLLSAQKEAQAHLNESYDALMDLAGVLGVPPKALSLNGELALAFAARGRGGVNAAAAHYERDTKGVVTDSTVVINLTRKHGAGSLAHEWFHALDNYFARARKERGGMLTEKPFPRGEGVRPEMVAAFKNLMDTIKRTALEQRSMALDKRRTKLYWSTGLEMAARSFESYTIEKLRDQGASNDYLANIVSPEYWAAEEALRDFSETGNMGEQQEQTYPYPTAAEIPAIRAAFDHFFDTIETKETDKGIAIQEGEGVYSVESRGKKYGDRASQPIDDLFGDPYENAEQRPGTTEKQRDLGRDALRDLSRRIGLDSVARRFNAGGSAPSILGAGLVRNFVAGQPNSLIGGTIQSPRDLAALAQVYRDPRFETFRIAYLKGDTVVGEAGYSSRMPGIVDMGNGFIADVSNDMKRFGADGYYAMHNHPSGSSAPSTADSTLTIELARKVSGFRGHVVIDHNEYSVLDASGWHKTHNDDKLGSADFRADPVVQSDLLGAIVAGPRDVVDLAKRVQKPDMATVVMTVAGETGRVNLVVDLPADALRSHAPRMGALIRRMARGSGSGGNRFLVLPDGYPKAAFQHLITYGVFTDVVGADGTSSVEELPSLYDVFRRRDVLTKGLKGARVYEPEALYSRGAEEEEDAISKAKQAAIAARNAFRAIDRTKKIEDADSYFDLSSKMSDAKSAFADALGQIPADQFALRGMTSDGRILLLTPSAQRPGFWQLTRFDINGEPWGDTQYPTREQATREFLDDATPESVTDHSAQFSRGDSAKGHTEAALYDRLRGLFGPKFMDRLFQTGRFRVITGQDAANILGAADTDALKSGGAVRGFYHRGNGITYLVADSIPAGFTDAQLKGLMRHEIGVHALKAGRDSAGWQKILGEIDRLINAGDKAAHAAFLRAGAAGTRDVDLLEEVAGYLVEDAPDSSIVRRILAWLKDQVFKLTGMQLKLTDADIVAMARAALRRAPDLLAGIGTAPRLTPVYSAPAPIWVSALRQRIAEQGAKTRTGNDWSAWLQGNAAKLGIKRDEIEWSGITDYLTARGKDKLTTAEITDWLSANGVQVQEVNLGQSAGAQESVGEIRARLTQALEAEGYGIEFDDFGGDYDVTYLDEDGEAIQYDELSLRAQEIVDRESQAELLAQMTNDTKYGQYQLPGGENYRELLLTLPVKDKAISLEEFAQAYRANNPRASEGTVRREYDRQVAEVEKTQYRSGHFEQPNILAHVRFNERTDADGKRVLFVEEVQSDWAQEGRKKGFKNDQRVVGWDDPAYVAVRGRATDALNAFNRASSNPTLQAQLEPELEAATSELRAIEAENNRHNKAAPPAPFVTDTKAWTKLALSRMIRYAVDNGFDAVAWTTGDQQYNRYPDADAESDTGKKRAEGMRAFYDGIVPQVARDLLKKIGGGGVESITFAPTGTAGVRGIPGVTPMQAFSQRGVEGAQPGFAITDQMREIAGRGMAMFSRAQNPVQGTMVPPAQPPVPPQQGTLNVQGGATGPGAQWTSTPTTPLGAFADTMLYRYQDKHIDLKRTQQAIKATGRQINEASDAYLKEELFHGRAATRAKEFLEDELDPLIADMRARGVSQEDLGRYLWARHAQEANEHIAAINPALPDGGSGMLTQEAQDYLAALTPQQQADYAALAARVDAITQTTRNALVNDKLISAQQRQDWESAYQHYVPLFRELEGNDTADLMTQGAGTGQGYSIKGAESKRRTGSQLPVADILGNIANARDKAIVRGEKARVGRALYALALTNKNPDFWRTAVAAPTIKTHDKNGMVIEIPDPLFKQRDNVVVVKVPTRKGNIVERAVIFNERDPRAARMARAIKNLDGQQLGEFLGAAASVTRYFASINTQYNPIFGVVNLIRDVQTAMLNLSSTPLAGKQAAVAADMARIVAGAMKHGLRDFDGPWKAIAREFEEAGGMTGYRDMFRTGQERTEAIEKALDPNWWQKRPWGRALTADGYLKAPAELMVDKGARPVMEWLSDYNQVLENATRLAAYKQARDSGLSKDASASIAKNLTVNFNRKGEMALQLGALYAFFNAATQGIARMGQTFAGPAGKYIVGGGVLAGVLQAMLLAAAGYDDEEPPQFVRERALILPTPWNKDRYVSIPMPLGFHVLPNFGRLIVEAMRTGDLMGKTASMMGIMADAFNPLGGSAPVAQILSPTATDPFVALGMNKDWTGKPIAREDFSNLHPTPGFTRARDAAGAPARWLAKALNRLSGGTDYTQGLISPTPDQIEYLAGQLTGGIGREAIKASTTATSIVTGDELPMHKVPLIGRFYGSTEGQAPQANKFYANLKKLNEHGATVKGLRADRRNAEVMEYLRDNPDARLFEAAGKAERKVSELRARRRALAERDASKAELKRVDDLITAQMVQLNDRMKALSK